MRHARSIRLGDGPLAAAAPIVVGASLAAAAGWAAARGQGSLLLVAGIAVAGIVALMRWPALTLLALVVVCEEVEPNKGFGAGGSSLLFLGHQLYFKGVSRASVLTLVAVLACARVAVIDPPRYRPRPGAVLLVIAMGFWFAATVWIGGSAVTSAINQDARFALLFVLTFVVGTWARDHADWTVHALSVMRWALTLLALIGAYLTATGQGQAHSGVNIIFYDSALGAFAGAVVLAVVLAPRAARTGHIWWLGGAALLVVILSSRRNVWAAMIVALLFGLAVAHDRARLVLRGLAGLGVLVIITAVAAPSVLSDVGHQLSAIWQASQGSAADNSTQGHLSDISTGIRAVLAQPISGVGAGGHVPGLVVETPGTLYIHNQILESWLRFGIVGGLLMIAVQIAFVVQGVRLLGRHAADLTVSWAALLLIMAPAAMITAPFFTETQRWPALLGLAAGLVAARPRAVRVLSGPATALPEPA